MIKKFCNIPALLLALVLLGSCTRNEFKVSFELSKSDQASYSLRWYASDSRQGWFVETVVPLHGGKGEAACMTRNPALVYIYQGGNLSKTVFYAERGDKIVITGNEPAPVAWSIAGNEINEKLTEWRLANREALSAGDSKRINGAVATYVAENSSSPVSTILLLEYFDRRADEAGFLASWKKLSGEASEEKWSELCGRSDVVFFEPESPVLPPSLIVRKPRARYDTLTFKGKPSLLFFYRNSDNGRPEGISMLRDLSKQWKDSASRILCSISFDSDSISWMTRLREDSLSGVVLAWNPLAELREEYIKMGVPRTPYYIVTGRNGKSLYRGDESSKAKEVFEKEMAKRGVK